MQNKIAARAEIISFLIALFILIIANIFVCLSDVRRESKSKTIDGLASWWAAKAYFAESKPPDIVVLGSSQLSQILGADAYVYDKVVDMTGDHRSRVLEQDFHMLLNKNWRVFVAAISGAMISDQLAIAHALFSKEYKPKLVAITFSPRDFIDNRFPSATSTEGFAFFSRYIDPISLRNDLTEIRTENYGIRQAHNYDFENRSSLNIGEPFERICPGEIIFCSGDDYLFKNNIEEYKQRYKNPMSLQLTTQMNYLDSLLKYLAQQHILAIAYNSPISAANRKLLPDKFWKYYDKQISEICSKNGADYISADRVVLPFEDNEFIDGIHLNLAGGLRWSRPLAVYMANKFHRITFPELLVRVKYLK